MKGPQFPFVTVCRPDVIQLTYLMDPAEFGVFMRLYMALYDHPDGLPDDDRLLMRLGNCSLKVWKRIRNIVLEKFTRVKHDDGRFYLTLECVLRDALRIKERASSQKAKVLKRWNTADTTVLPRNYRGNTNSLTPERSDKLQTPVQPPAPAREAAPPETEGSGDGGGEFANKFAGEAEFVEHNGRLVPSRIGNTVFDVASGGYVALLPKKPRKQPKVEAVPPASTSPRFRVLEHLGDAALTRARELAPGWDIHALAAKYDDNIAAGTHEVPRNPKAAFPAWCGRYTGGRAPGAERRAA